MSAYDARFSIHKDLIAIEHSPATLDETCAEFIMAAVDSACQTIPSKVQVKKTSCNNKAASTGVSTSNKGNGPVSLSGTVYSETFAAKPAMVQLLHLFNFE